MILCFICLLFNLNIVRRLSVGFYRRSTPTCLSLLLLIFSLPNVSTKKLNPLNGKHLKILPYNVPPQFRQNQSFDLRKYLPGPAKFHIDIVEWLSERNNFSFSLLNSNETHLEGGGEGKKGVISLLINGNLDIAVGEVIMLPHRFPYVDMPFPWHQTQAALLIPVSDVRSNVAAVLKPFQLPVWVGFVISTAAITASLAIYRCCLSRYAFIHSADSSLRRSYASWSTYLYVIGILLYQGGQFRSRILSAMLLATAWCLAGFFLSQAYTSTLFTFIISPDRQPLVNSINDVVANPEIRLLMQKKTGFDVMFSAATDNSGLFRHIRDRINKFPESRCISEVDCLQLVKSGGPYVFIKSYSYFLEIILNDYLETGQCHYQIAKERFMNLEVTFGFPKRNLYSDRIREGFIELNSFGLIDRWIKSVRANPRHCLNAVTQRRSENPRLPLSNLTGAFVVLAIGYILGLLVFCVECLVHVDFRSLCLKKQ